MISSRARAAALLGTTLVVGIVVGALGGPLVHRAREGRRSGPPSPAAITQRLARKLDLTPAQQDSVRAILERHRPTMDSLWSEFRPRIRTVEQTVQREISAQLDSTQRDKFSELVRKFERRRSELSGANPR